ncbi:MAG TPA: hypothetical protein VG167_00215 [Verrucomicrobiae bacterium]|nr:hypothetical protein [Verrucomicrobiae bacterium]
MSARAQIEQESWVNVGAELDTGPGAQARLQHLMGNAEHRDARLEAKELLRREIKRGREYLEETKQELATLRTRLEEWHRYEQVCGHNPLADYMQLVASKEEIMRFLPAWLERREAELRILG